MVSRRSHGDPRSPYVPAIDGLDSCPLNLTLLVNMDASPMPSLRGEEQIWGTQRWPCLLVKERLEGFRAREGARRFVGGQWMNHRVGNRASEHRFDGMLL